eukprot:782978_1
MFQFRPCFVTGRCISSVGFSTLVLVDIVVVSWFSSFICSWLSWLRHNHAVPLDLCGRIRICSGYLFVCISSFDAPKVDKIHHTIDPDTTDQLNFLFTAFSISYFVFWFLFVLAWCRRWILSYIFGRL